MKRGRPATKEARRMSGRVWRTPTFGINFTSILMKTIEPTSSKNSIAKFKSLPLWKKISAIGIPICILLITFSSKVGSIKKISQHAPVTVIHGPAIVGSSGYVLMANMSIAASHVNIRGLAVEGDMNFENSKGSSVEKSSISIDENNNSGGNINIKNSKIINATDNIIQKNINVNNSEIDNFNRNIVGFSR